MSIEKVIGVAAVNVIFYRFESINSSRTLHWIKGVAQNALCRLDQIDLKFKQKKRPSNEERIIKT